MNYRKWVLLAILVATFLSAMEGTIVSTAMPSIVADLNGMGYVNMTFSVYLLLAAVTTPIYGKLADMFGRKMVLATAIIIFLTGSALCGMASTMTQLILFRALQGLGAGAIFPVTSTIIGDIYTTEERTRIQPMLSGVWAISGVIGPLLGGFIVEAVNWRWIFYINVPFGLVSLLLIMFAFRERVKKKERRPVDWAGAGLFLLAMTSIMYVLLFSEAGAYFTPVNLLLIGVFCVSLAAFLYVERRAADPFFPLQLMKNRFVLVPNLFSFFGFSFLISTTVYIPMWIQRLLHATPTVSGFALAFVTFGWPLGASLNGWLMKRYGPRNVSRFGAALLVASAALLASVDVQSSIALFYIVMFTAGLAFGLSTTVFTIVLQNAVGWEQRGVAMGSNALMNTLGQTIFISVLGAVFNAVTFGQTSPESLAAGIHTVFLCVLGLTAAALLAAFALPRLSQEELFQGAISGAKK